LANNTREKRKTHPVKSQMLDVKTQIHMSNVKSKYSREKS